MIMKNVLKLFGAYFFMLLSGNDCLYAQQAALTTISEVMADSVNIAYSKTTNLVFPYAIKSVDIGSRDVLAQKAKGVENILQIKAAQENFPETNLTVITADGKLHSFILQYNEEHPTLNIMLSHSKIVNNDILFSPENLNEAKLSSYSKLAFDNNENIKGVRESNYDITFELTGIFIHNDMMYFRVSIENKSNINYDVDQIRFFIRDKKKAKRTASQEIEMAPLYVHNGKTVITGKNANTFVFALPKFTIPEKKYLVIQLIEHHGGRHLQVKVKDKKLAKVIVLPAL
jgi:conjugative transposon TraN protein